MRVLPFKACLMALIVLITLSALLNPSNSIAKSDSTAKMRVGITVAEFSSAILLAKALGLFQKQGLDVELVKFPYGLDASNALEVGKVDLAAASDVVVLGSIQDGEDIRILASISRYDNLDLIIRKDSGFRNVPDLKGKRIGYTFGTQADVDISRLLAFNSLSESDIEPVNLRPGQMLQAIETKKVDAIAVWSPYSLMIEDKLKDQVVTIPGQSGYKHYWVLIGRRTFVNDNHAALEKFFAALVAGEYWLQNNEEKAKHLISKEMDVNYPAFNRVWNNQQIIVELNQNLLLEMETQARWKLGKSSETRIPIPSLLDYFEPGPLKNVKPDAVWLIK